MSEQQKVYIALIASAFLHVLACLFLVAWTWLHPMDFEPEKPPPDLQQLEVTLMPPEEPAPQVVAMNAQPTPPPANARSFLDADGLQPTEKPPEKALFESDINSRAASELPATGSVPLPSQKGKDRAEKNFTTQDYSLGKGGEPAMAVAEAASEPEPTPVGITKVEKPKSTPPPEKEEPKNAESTPHPTPFFNPTPVPSATPEPTATPPDSIALGKPTPVPESTPLPTPAPTPPPQLAKLEPKPFLHTRPNPPLPDVRYQPQREQNKIDGNISNPGKSGADVVATSMGRYSKSIRDAIGSRWYYYVNNRIDLFSVGDVYVRFFIDADGHVQDAKIVSNTANDTFGSYCMRAVSEAKIPPLPPDVAPALDNGRLEITYHFNIYSQ